jgi:hypothetical protein
MQVLESEIERKCTTIAAKHRCILLKVEKRKGWPDRILMCPNGQMAWLEFKRPGEMPTKFQEHIHQELRAMNFRVYVVDNYSEFMTALLLLKGLDHPPGSPLTTK